MQGTEFYDEFVNQASLTVMESLLSSNELNLRNIDEFKKLLRWLDCGILYRSKRAFIKI